MASAQVRGLTIELGADASGVTKAFKDISKELKTTQDNLKDINKLLKLNPGNIDLLRQKQANLNTAIEQTEKRLGELKQMQSQVGEGTAEWDAIQREIIETEGKLKNLKKEQQEFGSVAKQVLKNAGQQVSAFGDKVSEAGSKLSGLSAGAGAIGGALLKLGYDSVKSADEINTLSKQTGLTTDEIQKLQYASDRLDVSFESVSGALKKFKSKIDPSNESLKALGIETQNADGSLRNANDVFFETVSALGNIENETERDQVAMELFGKSADELAGLIDDGGESFRELGQEAENLGLILDKDTLDSLNETNDQLDSLKANLKGTAAQIGANVGTVVAPLLEKIAGLIESVTARLREMNPETMETILKVVGIAAAVAPVIIVIGKVISGVGAIISILPLILSPVGLVIAAIAALVAIGVVLYKNWDKIKEFAGKLWDGIKEGWNKVKEGITGVVNTVKETVQNRLEGIKKTFEENGGGIEGAIAVAKEGIVNQWTAMFNTMDTLTGGKLSELKETFSAKVTEIKDKVKEIWQNIKDFFKEPITLPHIKMPHFVITPAGWGIGDLLKGVIPKLSIEWYRKAYDNPVMFTSPTVMATPYGYKGFGDGNGAEIVMGLDKLREMVGGMDRDVNVTVVLEGDARNLFKVINRQNSVRTRATSYNALAVGG